MENGIFDSIKNKYIEMRERERNGLSDYLAEFFKNDDRFKVVTGGRSGKGSSKYSSGKRFGDGDEYILSNWKWIEVKMIEGNRFSCVISLNMLESDPGNGNVHALYDRIGFVISGSNEEYGVLVDERKIITNIELPLDESKKLKIKKILQEVVIKRMWELDFPKI